MEPITVLTLVGGDPALDLVNTRERGVTAPGEQQGDALGSPADLVTWALRTGVVEEAEAEAAAPRSLTRARVLREALHVLVLARLDVRAWADPEVDAARQTLERAHSAALTRSRLVTGDDDADPWRWQVGAPGPHLVEDRVAVAAVRLLTGSEVARIRRCPVESGGCGWVFVDRTRNGSRTWCRMADCGTQVKSRRLTERRRITRASGAAS